MKQEAITYGSYSNAEWHTINGLSSVEHVILRIKQEIDWKGYQLWIHGSILSDVDTHDIDLTITGPVIPQKINQLLQEIVQIGFEEKIFCDVKFNITNDLYDPTRDSVKTIRYACYRDKIRMGNQTFHYAQHMGELYFKEERFPMTKTLRSGIVYKSPLRVI